MFIWYLLEEERTHQKIIRFDNSDDSANASFEQDLIHVIIKKVSLKKLEGKSKIYCQTGHKMEEVYTNELMHKTDVPFEEIDMICKVGLVEKKSSPYLKDSVDRIICYSQYNSDSRSKSLLLTEFKARLSSARADEERRLVLAYHKGEKYVTTHSNDTSFWNFIADPKERLQVLHYCFTYGQDKCLHITGDSKNIISSFNHNWQ